MRWWRRARRWWTLRRATFAAQLGITDTSSPEQIKGAITTLKARALAWENYYTDPVLYNEAHEAAVRALGQATPLFEQADGGFLASPEMGKKPAITPKTADEIPVEELELQSKARTTTNQSSDEAYNGDGFIPLGHNENLKFFDTQLRVSKDVPLVNTHFGINTSIATTGNAKKLSSVNGKSGGELVGAHKYAIKNRSVLFRNSRVAVKHKDKKFTGPYSRPNKEDYYYIRLYTPFKYDGNLYVVQFSVRDNPESSGLHALEALEVVKAEEVSAFSSGPIQFDSPATQKPHSTLTVNKIAYSLGNVKETNPISLRDGSQISPLQLFQEIQSDLTDFQKRAETRLRLENSDVKQNPADNFKAWFGNSKVVDENGKPLVVYHGTGEDFKIFQHSKIGSNTKNKGIFGNGFYAIDQRHIAERYATYNRLDGKVIPLFVNMRNPFRWSEAASVKIARKLGFPENRIKNGKLLPLVEEQQILDFTAKLKAAGYDGTIYTYPEGGSEYCVWDSNQFKSAEHNSGAYDGSNPDIYQSPSDRPYGEGKGVAADGTPVVAGERLVLGGAYPYGGRTMPLGGAPNSPAMQKGLVKLSTFDLVSIYKDLSGGHVPKVVTKGMRDALGRYWLGKKLIELRSQIFGLCDESDIAYLRNGLTQKGYFRHLDENWVDGLTKNQKMRKRIIAEEEARSEKALETALDRLVKKRIKNRLQDGIGSRVMALSSLISKILVS